MPKSGTASCLRTGIIGTLPFLETRIEKGFEVLRARIRWSEADSFARYVRPLVGVESVSPGYLPTQANGRWSITNPPLITFPDKGKADARGLPRLREMVVPD